MYKSVLIVTMAVGLAAGLARGVQAPATGAARPAATDANALDTALKNLQDKAIALKSYQVSVDYVFKQPILESQQRRTGVLVYAKSEEKGPPNATNRPKSNLRIDFLTLQQDEEKEKKYVLQYFFDGVWLLEVDPQLKAATKRQLAEPDKPLDALALASKQLPVLGFSQVEDLRKQFEITLVAEPPGQPTRGPHLHLKTRPDSVYKNDYVTIDLWIDSKIGLPVQVQAVTTEQDIYEIKLTDPKVNAPLDPKLFQADIPRGFSEQAIPLPRNGQGTPPQ
jgi:outer membrane lipoprotein-sorting protein